MKLTKKNRLVQNNRMIFKECALYLPRLRLEPGTSRLLRCLLISESGTLDNVTEKQH